MLKVDFYNRKPSEIEPIYVVIVAKYKGKWLFVRHKERNTYEVPGGHIESGEDYVTAAKRELYEETGAIDFTLDLVSVYTVNNNNIINGGYLFFADVKNLSNLPDYEIAEFALFEHLPENLTYPQIQPHLFAYVQRWIDSCN